MNLRPNIKNLTHLHIEPNFYIKSNLFVRPSLVCIFSFLFKNEKQIFFSFFDFETLPNLVCFKNKKSKKNMIVRYSTIFYRHCVRSTRFLFFVFRFCVFSELKKRALFWKRALFLSSVKTQKRKTIFFFVFDAHKTR